MGVKGLVVSLKNFHTHQHQIKSWYKSPRGISASHSSMNTVKVGRHRGGDERTRVAETEKNKKKRKQFRKTYHPILLISVSWIPSHLELRNGVLFKFLQNKARSLLESYGWQDLRSRKILFFGTVQEQREEKEEEKQTFTKPRKMTSPQTSGF